jgi:hypothetical protein
MRHNLFEGFIWRRRFQKTNAAGKRAKLHAK